MKIVYGLIYEMDFAMQFLYVFLLCSLIVLPVLQGRRISGSFRGEGYGGM